MSALQVKSKIESLVESHIYPLSIDRIDELLSVVSKDYDEFINDKGRIVQTASQLYYEFKRIWRTVVDNSRSLSEITKLIERCVRIADGTDHYPTLGDKITGFKFLYFSSLVLLNPPFIVAITESFEVKNLALEYLALFTSDKGYGAIFSPDLFVVLKTDYYKVKWINAYKNLTTCEVSNSNFRDFSPRRAIIDIHRTYHPSPELLSSILEFNFSINEAESRRRIQSVEVASVDFL